MWGIGSGDFFYAIDDAGTITKRRGVDMAHDESGGLNWRKSSFSIPGGNCVELAPLPGGGVAVRDSKDPSGSVLRFTGAEWTAFCAGYDAGEFDGLRDGDAAGSEEAGSE
jgi:hypothetical protein